MSMAGGTLNQAWKRSDMRPTATSPILWTTPDIPDDSEQTAPAAPYQVRADRAWQVDLKHRRLVIAQQNPHWVQAMLRSSLLLSRPPYLRACALFLSARDIRTYGSPGTPSARRTPEADLDKQDLRIFIRIGSSTPTAICSCDDASTVENSQRSRG